MMNFLFGVLSLKFQTNPLSCPSLFASPVPCAGTAVSTMLLLREICAITALAMSPGRAIPTGLVRRMHRW